MSQAVIVSSLMIMTLMVSKESLARDRHAHTDTHTHRLGSSTLKFANFAYDFADKKEENTT